MIQQGRSWSGHERNCAFLNTGEAGVSGQSRFATISAVTGLDFDDDARGIAVLDWDHDGDLDLWIRNRNAPSLRLMKNEAGREAGNFLRLHLRGDGVSSNADVIGARVEVILSNSDLPIVRSVRAGDTFLSQSSKVLHFGLGTDSNATIEKVSVRWPDHEGTQVVFDTGLEPNHTYRIEQGMEPVQLSVRMTPVLEPLPVELPVEESTIRVFAQSYLPLSGLSYRDATGDEIIYEAKPEDWTLLNLWATWCSPCRAELQSLSARADELKAAKIEVVALSVDLTSDFSPESPLVAEATGILEELQFPFLSGFAGAEMVSGLQAINDNLTSLNRDLPVPCSFLVSPSNRIVAIYKGPVSVDQILEDAKSEDDTPGDRLKKTMALGGTLVPSQQVSDARADLEAALQFSMGRQMFPVSSLAGAMHFSEALRLKQDFIEPRIHLAIALNKMNQLTPAREQLAIVLSLDPGDEEKSAAYYQLSEIALKQGALDEAMTQLEATIRFDPSHVFALNNLGFLLASKNQVGSEAFERALGIVERAVEKTEQKQPNFLDTLGGVYQKAGRFEEAITVFETALTIAKEQKQGGLAAKISPKLAECRRQLDSFPVPK